MAMEVVLDESDSLMSFNDAVELPACFIVNFQCPLSTLLLLLLLAEGKFKNCLKINDSLTEGIAQQACRYSSKARRLSSTKPGSSKRFQKNDLGGREGRDGAVLDDSNPACKERKSEYRRLIVQD